jgi:hypothetical protein
MSTASEFWIWPEIRARSAMSLNVPRSGRASCPTNGYAPCCWKATTTNARSLMSSALTIRACNGGSRGTSLPAVTPRTGPPSSSACLRRGYGPSWRRTVSRPLMPRLSRFTRIVPMCPGTCGWTCSQARTAGSGSTQTRAFSCLKITRSPSALSGAKLRPAWTCGY